MLVSVQIVIINGTQLVSDKCFLCLFIYCYTPSTHVTLGHERQLVITAHSIVSIVLTTVIGGDKLHRNNYSK